MENNNKNEQENMEDTFQKLLQEQEKKRKIDFNDILVGGTSSEEDNRPNYNRECMFEDNDDFVEDDFEQYDKNNYPIDIYTLLKEANYFVKKNKYDSIDFESIKTNLEAFHSLNKEIIDLNKEMVVLDKQFIESSEKNPSNNIECVDSLLSIMAKISLNIIDNKHIPQGNMILSDILNNLIVENYKYIALEHNNKELAKSINFNTANISNYTRLGIVDNKYLKYDQKFRAKTYASAIKETNTNNT